MDIDELTIKMAQKGDKESFRKIVECYQKVVFAVCFNVLKDYQEAENAAQETFIKIYSSLSTYEFKGFKTWISRIALHKSIDIKRKLENSKTKTISLDDDFELQISDNKSIEDEFIKTEDLKKLTELYSSLPEAYSSVIKKFYIDDKSYEQIANEEGISVKTVESRLYRGRKKLKELLTEGGSLNAL